MTNVVCGVVLLLELAFLVWWMACVISERRERRVKCPDVQQEVVYAQQRLANIRERAVREMIETALKCQDEPPLQ